MAFDAFFCAAVAAELDSFKGARVDRLFHTGTKSLVFALNKERIKSNLVISAEPGRPGVYVSEREFLKPETPTPLCMLFRKHLSNGRLVSVTSVENERIIVLSFMSADDMGYVSEKRLYIELIGKYTNIILVSGEGKIISAAEYTEVTASRHVMPGAEYSLPAGQNKRSVLSVTREGFYELYNREAQTECEVSEFLLSNFLSLSPLTARELCYLCTGRTDSLLSQTDREVLFGQLEGLGRLVRKKEFVPFTVSRGGVGVEYSFFPIRQYGEGAVGERKESFSELLDSFYTTRQRNGELVKYASDIQKTIKNSISRIEKKTSLQLEELEECAKRDSYKKKADLIISAIYMIQPGASEAKIYDYEEDKEVIIELDARKSASDNAQMLYKKYTKLKKAEVVLQAEIEKSQEMLKYLHSVAYNVETAKELSVLKDIRQELDEAGCLKVKKKKSSSGSKGKKSNKKLASEPLSFITSGGYLLKVGRNNIQNDMLTMSAEKTDIWFHVKEFHGSHCVLYAKGEEPPARDYTEAAMTAAFFSEMKGASNVAVDYTHIRYIKKPSGSPAGFVTYDRNYTAFVNAQMPDIDAVRH